MDVLVGREAERQVIETLVAGARVGQSGTLVLAGEAGIGKSALLDATAAAARDHGMRVLRATGSVAEAEVPFGGLLELLRPALAHLDAIPEPQAQALAAALALRPGVADDRFAIGAATLSLLSRLAEEQPLLVLVDDAHLLDRPSAQALCFACRRLTADPIVVLLAVREGAPCTVAEAALPCLVVAGLADEAADELVSSTGHQLGADVLARLRAATGGNPLALLELAGEAARLDVLPPEAPVPVPSSLAVAFGRRAELLSPDARTAVLVAAAAGPDVGLVARACGALGVAVGDLDEAQAVDLLRVDADGVVFRHGLVRSAVYAQATPQARRSVHRALADALPEADVERRAWHLGEAALGPDDETARVLEAAAVRARERSAHAVAASMFERAARLSQTDAARVLRLVSAAECAWLAGSVDTAVGLLGEVSWVDQPLALRARAASLAGLVAARTGSLQAARDVLVEAGTAAAQEDPEVAVTLLADAALACLFAADTAGIADAATRIETLLHRVGDGRAAWMGQMAVGVAGVLTGRGGPDRIRAAVARAAGDEELLRDVRLAPWLVLGPLFLRESGIGRELVTTVTDHLRQRGAVGQLPFILFQLGRDQATTDQWDDAEATYTEGIHLAREAGHSTDLAACLSGLAAVEARRGKQDLCRLHVEEALRISREHDIGFFRAWSHTALAELSLALGRPDEAVAHLEDLDALLAELGFADVDLSPAPDLVDALVRLGEHDRARELAERHLQRASAKGQPWAVARALRAVGTTCPDDDVDDVFARALALHERTPDSFEKARTQLALGARLRRARRRVEARQPLRLALASFERLGAGPWADQAEVELRATGATAQRRGAGGFPDLTPQELQVARMLAGGRTTRETAAALFLSPKTIEYHLRHVYLKLDVRSRPELAARLAAPSDAREGT